MRRVVLLLAGTLACAPSAAHAQAGAAPRPRSFELSVGAIGIAAVDFGAATAALVGNEASGPESTLFNTSTRLGAARGLDGRVAFSLTRALAVEGGFVWTRATLSSRITSDVEGIPDVTATQELDTYFIEASAVWHLSGLGFGGGRGVPFLSGGAGYLRQLDSTKLLTSDPGEVYHAGGGVKYLFLQRPRGFVRGLGVRGDGRLYIQSGGVELDDDTERRNRWAVAGSLLVRF